MAWNGPGLTCPTGEAGVGVGTDAWGKVVERGLVVLEQSAVHHPGKTTLYSDSSKAPTQAKWPPTPHAKPPAAPSSTLDWSVLDASSAVLSKPPSGCSRGASAHSSWWGGGRSGSSSWLLPPAGDPQPPGSSLPCHFSPRRILGGTLGLRASGNPEKATAPSPT